MAQQKADDFLFIFIIEAALSNDTHKYIYNTSQTQIWFRADSFVFSKTPRNINSVFFVLQMQECSNLVGVPMSHIFPVKNYHEEIDTHNDIDVLILRALTQIVHIADDLLNRRKTCSEKR